MYCFRAHFFAFLVFFIKILCFLLIFSCFKSVLQYFGGQMKRFCILFLLFLFSARLFAAENEKLILAVMEFEDRSGTLSEKTLSDAAEYLRSAFANSNKFLLIAKERQEKAMINEMKKESYKACNDKNCQIPLGQALSADTILRTTINFFGGIYTITSEFIDLAREATVIAAKQKFDGSERSLMEALDKIEEKITGYTKDNEVIGNNQENKEVMPVAPAAPVEVKNPEPAEEKPAEPAAETKPQEEPVKEETPKEEPAKEEPAKEKADLNTYRPYKIAGISLIAAGAAVAAAGVAGFHVAADKKLSKYKDMTHKEKVSAADKQKGYDEYLKKANGYRDDAKTFRALEIASGALGGALVVTGVVLVLIKKEKTDEKVSLSSFSLVPANEGFYASLGFDF